MEFGQSAAATERHGRLRFRRCRGRWITLGQAGAWHVPAPTRAGRRARGCSGEESALPAESLRPAGDGRESGRRAMRNQRRQTAANRSVATATEATTLIGGHPVNQSTAKATSSRIRIAEMPSRTERRSSACSRQRNSSERAVNPAKVKKLIGGIPRRPPGGNCQPAENQPRPEAEPSESRSTRLGLSRLDRWQGMTASCFHRGPGGRQAIGLDQHAHRAGRLGTKLGRGRAGRAGRDAAIVQKIDEQLRLELVGKRSERCQRIVICDHR